MTNKRIIFITKREKDRFLNVIKPATAYMKSYSLEGGSADFRFFIYVPNRGSTKLCEVEVAKALIRLGE